MKYELTKDLETGNAVIDREHKELFGAVNRLLDACGKGQGRAAMESAIQFLLDYVDKHFANEERLQKTSGYPNISAHKTFHAGYKKTLKEIAVQIPDTGACVSDLGKLNNHIAVLISHIRSEDKRLGEFLR